MKIKLERKLASCPNPMICVVCHHPFEVRDIRALLYSDHHLIQGDICPVCLRLKPALFQQKLKAQGDRLRWESAASSSSSGILQARAVELLETADESIQFPTIFHWLFKKIEILAAERQELEAAKLGIGQCGCQRHLPQNTQKTPKFRILFTDEDSQTEA
jgi:hypothetical protein